MKLSVSLTTAVCALVFPAVAAAQADQPWLQDRRYTEGIGYRVGDLELHPGLGAEFGYDSNYFHRASSENPISSLRLRITPSFSLSTLSQQRREAGGGGAPPPDFEFRAGLSATYNEFFPVGTANDAESELMRDQRNVSGVLNLNLVILPSRPWSGILYADLGRNITPSNAGETSLSFNRIQTNAGGELAWTPGGGLFDWRLGYRFGGTLFESSEFSDLTSLEHTIQTRGRWRFLPRTALMYDGRFSFINYPSGTEKTSSRPVRALLGLNGLVTNSFAILAMAGWGASFYTQQPGASQPEDFDSVIWQGEVKYYLTPNPSSDPAAATLSLSSVAAGVTRDFFDSYIGTYYQRDRGYLNFSYFFGGRFLVILEGGAGAISYPAIEPLAEAPWTDVRVDASLFGEYRFKDSFGINSTVRYGTNLSDNSISVGPATEELQWQEFEAYLGVRWFM